MEGGRDGPWPDLIRAYFWPAINKRPTRVLSDSTRSNFFLTRREKIEKFDVFRGNFQNSNPNHKWLTRPEPQKIDPTRPGSKNFDPDPSLEGGQPNWTQPKKKEVIWSYKCYQLSEKCYNFLSKLGIVFGQDPCIFQKLWVFFRSLQLFKLSEIFRSSAYFSKARHFFPQFVMIPWE